jgi:hypothetical protein
MGKFGFVASESWTQNKGCGVLWEGCNKGCLQFTPHTPTHSGPPHLAQLISEGAKDLSWIRPSAHACGVGLGLL